MKHDFIIIFRGKVGRRVDDLLKALGSIGKQINSFDLRRTKLFMSQEDYEDIVAWSKTLPIK